MLTLKEETQKVEQTIQGILEDYYSSARKALIDEIDQLIDLRVIQAKVDLGFDTPENLLARWQERRANMEQLRAAGYELVDEAEGAMEWKDVISGQVEVFETESDMADFVNLLHTRKPLVEYHLPYSDETVVYFPGQERAALKAYQDMLDSMGLNAVEYKINPAGEYDLFAYLVYLANVGEFGLGPGDDGVYQQADFIKARATAREQLEHEDAKIESFSAEDEAEIEMG